MTNEYNKNKPIIDAYFKNQSVENFSKKDNTLILGMSVGVFVTLFIVGLVIFIWSLYVSIVYWNQLSKEVKILLVISWFVAPPILPLIVVYVGKGSQNNANSKQISYNFGHCGM